MHNNNNDDNDDDNNNNNNNDNDDTSTNNNTNNNNNKQTDNVSRAASWQLLSAQVECERASMRKQAFLKRQFNTYAGGMHITCHMSHVACHMSRDVSKAAQYFQMNRPLEQ